MTIASEILRHTPLHALHLELGGKMVPFAGYEMPVQFPAGVLKEHLHTREKAGCSMSRTWARVSAGDTAALSVTLPMSRA
jgi:aminomethyltransferase